MTNDQDSVARAPLREALRRKRRQIVACLLLAVVVAGVYPSLRDKLNAVEYVDRLAPGSVLIATPRLYGPLFRNTELLILQHGDQGTWALVLGVPVEKGLARIPRLSEAERQLLLDNAMTDDYWGGPVDAQQRVRLHAAISSDAAQVGHKIGTTGLAFRRMDEDSDTQTDSHTIQFLGYTGWSAGQLQSEIRRGSWQVPANPEAVLARHFAWLQEAHHSSSEEQTVE